MLMASRNNRYMILTQSIWCGDLLMPDINMKNTKKRPDIAIRPFDFSGIISGVISGINRLGVR